MDDHLLNEFDNFDLRSFTSLAAQFGSERYGLVVTPNIDHMIRLREDLSFRMIYRSATFVLLDSRLAAILFRCFKGLRLNVCAGSDLTSALIDEVIRPTDHIVIVGSCAADVELLRNRFGLLNVDHHNPPMDFINNPEAVDRCLSFVESTSPFRFCFMAVGSPQQEIIGDMLRKRGVARGLVLCVGASFGFLTGRERRAPSWMRRGGLEWVYRLAQNPRRLAHRYLVRGPRFFLYFRHLQIVLRRPDTFPD